MPHSFQLAKADDVNLIFGLDQKRVHWMDDMGIMQWNVTDYLEAYPIGYYAEQQMLGNLYALKDDKTVLGAVVLLQSDDRWPDRADSPAYYVHNLITDPAVSGAGREILAEAEKLAIRHGKHFMRLDCAVDNVFLNTYYGAMGYEFAGHCEDGAYAGNRREKKLP